MLCCVFCVVFSALSVGVCVGWVDGHFSWQSGLLLGSIPRFEFWDLARVERLWGLLHFGCKKCAEIK